MAKNRKKKGPAPRKKTPTTPAPKKQQPAVDVKETGKKLKTGIITAIVVVVIIVGLLILALVLSNDSSGSQSSAEESTQSSLDSGESIIDETKTYYADIDIKDYGKITVELDPESAPKTVENFVKLANSKFYDGLTFHRIMEGFMMQGGQAKEGMEEPETIVGEFSSNGYNNTISHTRGTISMARTTDPNSASSQFFIVQKDSQHLDGDYAGFGHVTEGMDVVDKVCEDAKPTDDNGTIPENEQPIINSITIRTEDK